MSLVVRLEDERGGRVGEPVIDSSNRLIRLFPPPEGDLYHCLPYINRYGDTVFNVLQMKPFLREWDLLRSGAAGEEERLLIEAVTELARQVEEEYHLYLRFAGD